MQSQKEAPHIASNQLLRIAKQLDLKEKERCEDAEEETAARSTEGVTSGGQESSTTHTTELHRQSAAENEKEFTKHKAM